MKLDDDATSEGDTASADLCILSRRLGRYRYFGARLLRARRRSGLSLTDLASLVGITEQALSRWELGQVKPHPRNMKAVAQALKLDPVEQIFDWEEENELLLGHDASESKNQRSVSMSNDLELSVTQYDLVAKALESTLADNPEANRFSYFGAFLLRERRRAGLSLVEVSKRSGVAQPTLSQWEIGDVVSPDPVKLAAVAAAIGISPISRVADWFQENQRLLVERALVRQVGVHSSHSHDDASVRSDGEDEHIFTAAQSRRP